MAGLAAAAVMTIGFGLIGTGYAASRRAEYLAQDPRGRLVAVAGHTWERVQQFIGRYPAAACGDWQEVIQHPQVDVVIVATVNGLHGEIVGQAVAAGKGVVVEYPLALDYGQAAQLVQQARAQGVFLHVEHIELLSPIHQALQEVLPKLGTVTYGRSVNLVAQYPAPRKWTYHHQWFGFPLVAGLARVNRLLDLLGPVAWVFCEAAFADTQDGYYRSCRCSALLGFVGGALVELTYGKGETIWEDQRHFSLHGTQGGVLFEGDQGEWVTPTQRQTLTLPGRQGLFHQDMRQVLDHLTRGTPLYTTPEKSLAALRVATALQASAQRGQRVVLAEWAPPGSGVA
ncbi:MAG: Gfo/Idh/MocA family oxidoreductase [Gloeomargarita sp. GMQP_bins_120]